MYLHSNVIFMLELKICVQEHLQDKIIMEYVKFHLSSSWYPLRLNPVSALGPEPNTLQDTTKVKNLRLISTQEVKKTHSHRRHG